MNAYEVAAQVRKFRLLAERPELLYPDVEMRVERLLSDDNRSQLDVALLAEADDTDRICATAVAMMSKYDFPRKRAEPILTLLGTLPAEDIVAMYHALPRDRRYIVDADEVWAYHLHHQPDITDAVATLNDLAADDDVAPDQILEPQEAAEFQDFTKRLLRRAIQVPHDLSEDEEALAVAGEQAMADVMPDGD
jgi:hypothetical protein